MPASTLSQLVAAGHLLELGAVERVEADVEPVEPGLAQVVGAVAQRGAVGGHRQVDAELRQLGDERGDVGPNRRLAAGEADAVEPEALDADAGEPLDLLEREDLAARHPLHPFFRHAVRAAEVAAVGDRDPQVAHDAAERIDQIVSPRVLHHVHQPTGATTQPTSHHDGDFAAGGHAVAVGHDGDARWTAPWPPADGCPGRRPSARGSARRPRTWR